MAALSSCLESLCCLWLLVFLLQAHRASAATDAGCPPGHWGRNCEARCLCVGRSNCAQDTGECPGGCRGGQMGTGCQYVDAAHGKTSSQSSTQDQRSSNTPDLAVDGDVISCTRTEVEDAPWWQVDLARDNWLDHFRFLFEMPVNVTVGVSRNASFEGQVSLCEGKAVWEGSSLDLHCPPVRGRYLRVTANTSQPSYLALCDVRVDVGRNLALDKRAVQSSEASGNGGVTFPASLAVDGMAITDFRKGTCSLTSDPPCGKGGKKQGTRNPWWQVELEGVARLKEAIIFNDVNNARLMRKFKLLTRIPGTSKFKAAYTDTSKKIQPGVLPILMPPDTQTDAVRLELRGRCRRLGLCEVQLLGDCLDGHWGWNCSEKCGCLDQNEACNKVTGACPASGCPPGLTGLACLDDCPLGRYGFNCSGICPGCMGLQCHPATGSCLAGCSTGWQEPLCIECQDGHWGWNCTEKCGCLDQSEVCSKATGACPTSGCPPGLTGLACQDACPQGQHGLNCSQSCPGCLGEHCDPKTGRCQAGCRDGWQGLLCKDCRDGHWGWNCSEKCGCLDQNEVCNKVTGACPASGCPPGLTGLACLDACPKGRYGAGCTGNCSRCLLGQCDPVDGGCDLGCQAGWRGFLCNRECQVGYYGVNCSKPCSTDCLNSTCSPFTGVCEAGCRAGRKGSYCQLGCEKGRHGEDCVYNCSATCLGQQCHNETGECTLGCEPDWLGVYCDIQEVESMAALPEGEGAGTESGGRPGEAKTPKEGAMPMLAIIITAAAGVLLLIIILIAALIVRRRKSTQRKAQFTYRRTMDSVELVGKLSYNHDESPAPDACDEDHIDTRPLERAESLVTSPEGGATSSHDISVSYLGAHLAAWRLQPHLCHQQFKDLPQGLIAPHTFALTDQNKMKNRYKDVYPYDHSRVILTTQDRDPDSDYINACYIDGYDRERKYVAAQGPMENTLHDFVRMIWELGSQKIVMLTNPTEEGKQQCAVYWSDGEEVTVGDIRVRLVQSATYAHCTQRILQLSKAGVLYRTVEQLQFTAWPDKDVPASPWPLLDFRQRVAATPGNGPIIVHCSAGLGRTGTFLALDVCLQEALERGSVDVFHAVWRLRQQRVNLVQTESQYFFLHEAVMAGTMTSAPTSLAKLDFASIHETDEFGRPAFQNEFMNLCECLPPVKEADFYSATLPENASKNRVTTILAGDRYRPYLMTEFPGHNDYINAVYITGSLRQRQYLQTQTPLTETVIDFWRLVWEESISVIVNLDDDQASGHVPSPANSLQIGVFQVETLSSEARRGVVEKSLRLSHLGQSSVPGHYLREFRFPSWRAEDEVPPCPADFLLLLENVQKEMAASSSPVLVHCRSGAKRSGLFLAASLALEHLQNDRQVSLARCVAEVKVPRRDNVTSSEQYVFLFCLLKTYSENQPQYFNVSDLQAEVPPPPPLSDQ